MMDAIIRRGCRTIQHGAFVALALTGLISGAEAKIVVAAGAQDIASRVEPSFKPEPPPSIQHWISPQIEYHLYGGIPYGGMSSGSNSAPSASFGPLRTMAITRSVRNDAIRLRLTREAEQHGFRSKRE
jgi:hypothetical protein